ncbi:MAG TPA: hypothetical protein ENH41_03865 [Candidatus Omnitrophica bacterium]|nr:hypothetical protein [Candidatus Omnitrophota bacterium]
MGRIISCLLLLTISTFCFVQAEAKESFKKNEDNFFSKFMENSILKKEVILGTSWSDEKSEVSLKNSLGFEVLKKFSGKTGDWASALIQMRFVRYDHEYMLMNTTKMTPAHVDGMHTFELEFHDAYFKYSGRFKGRLNFRIGHFDVPYGLEQNVDTHTTLMQLTAMRNVGFKKDWGFSIGGQLPKMDYEFSFTRGSGAEYRDRGENYLFSGRLGTPADENFSIGLSGLYGEVIDEMGVMRGMKTGAPNIWFDNTTKPGDDIIKCWRIGLDSIYLYGPFTFKEEVSYGEDVNQGVINGVLEIDYLFPGMDERLEAVFQVQSAYQDITASGGDNDTFMLLGLNYRISKEVTIQSTYRHDLQRLKNTENEDIVAMQVYCYF